MQVMSKVWLLSSVLLIVLLTACGGGGGGGGASPPPAVTSATSTVTLAGSSLATTGLDVKMRFPVGVTFLSYTAVGPAARPDSKSGNVDINSLSLMLSKFTGITNGDVIKVSFRIDQGSPQSSAFQLYSSYATIGAGSQNGGTLSLTTQIQ